MTAMARPALLYFLLWLGVMDLEKRIVEGQTCPDADRLYHVRLIAKEIPEWESHCSGSLISDQWVLTAAHCVEPGQTMTAYVNIHPGGEKEEIEVTQHEIYEEKDIDHNIMLVKLKAKPKKIHKIDLPTAADCAKDIEMSKKFQIAGHGLSAVDKDIKKYLEAESKKLQCLEMPVIDCKPVKDVMAEQDPVEPYDHVFCAQVKDKEPSPGDSGGGALYSKKIYGVFISCHETTPLKEPCRFMRVCKYLKWIEKTTKSP